MNAKTLKFFWLAALGLVVLTISVKTLGQGLKKRKQPIFIKTGKNLKEEIHGLEIEKFGEKIILQKKEGRWRMLEPEVYPARETSVIEIIDALARAKIGVKISSHKDKFSDFHLDQARGVAITVKDPAGKQLVKGMIGNAVAGRWDSVYFAFDGAGEIYMLEGLNRFSFERAVWEYKDRAILAVSLDQLSYLKVSYGKTQYRLDYDGKDWKVGGKPAEQKKAMEIANLFTAYEANAFPTAQELAQGLKALGLEGKPKEALVVIGLKDGARHELWIGAQKDSLYYVKLKGKETIWKVTDWKIKPLQTAPPPQSQS